MISRLCYFAILPFIFLNTNCVAPYQPHGKLMPGMWRAELFLDENNVPVGDISQKKNTRDILTSEMFTDGVLPFNFEVSFVSKDSMVIHIINGSDRMELKDISFGRNRKTGHDTIMIMFDLYDTYIKANVEEGLMTGAWYVPRKNISIPFRAIAGKEYRFTLLKETPKYDISGKWKAIFDPENPDTTVGEFIQKSNHLTGTFLTTTGDYGHLDGTVQGDRLYLSKFDGGHAMLFSGQIKSQNQIEGIFLSGKTYKTTWNATKDKNIKLPDANTITLKSTDRPIQFGFINSEGTKVNLNDAKYQGKPKVIQIMGTWCPNCKDESAFLQNYLITHPNSGIEFIAISFEYFTDTARVLPLLQRYKKSLQLPYQILWGGKAQKDTVAKVLPFLDHFVAYPTMVYLDRHNRIVKIHTGFSGPATSEYDKFKEEFNATIEQLKNIP